MRLVLSISNRVLYILPALISAMIIGMWPFIGRSSTNIIKYLPVFMAIMIIVMYQVVSYMKTNQLKTLYLRQNWIAYLLFLMYIGGSFFSMLVFGRQITFLSQGMVMFGFFYGFLFGTGLGLEKVKGVIIPLVFLTSVPILIGVAIQDWGHGIPHHEFIYLCIPICLYPYFKKFNLKSFLFSFIGILIIMYISGKNTTYIICLISLLFALFMRSYLRDYRSLIKILFRVAIIAIPIAMGLFSIWYELYFSGQISTGNLDFRLFLYADAILKFLESPLYGSFFTDSPTHNMADYFGRFLQEKYLYLPTHSDILDLFAHGGLLAGGLFIAMIVKLFRNFFALIVSESIEHRAFHMLLMLTVMNILIIISINPIFNMPINGVLCWFFIGLLSSMNYQLRRQL
ncbi:O-antigen ligase family protein [Reichenbachiella agariperforans]|uniref:O-antigen ligase family protein n=1 Tax=Reichenbachiella agariperforans TaxID=156994 RepID=UPI001C0816E1|nr:hypothetical protein [Reichenbachiella agariperforans]MBU2916045.1 hypothetical protein [Reichenbachiella agariperforans]